MRSLLLTTAIIITICLRAPNIAHYFKACTCTGSADFLMSSDTELGRFNPCNAANSTSYIGVDGDEIPCTNSLFNLFINSGFGSECIKSKNC